MTLKDMLKQAVDARGDAVFLRFKDRGYWHTISYNEFLVRVWHVAEMLHALGIKPGDHVALYHENSPVWPEVYFGIVGIGATAVPMDAKLREQEISHILRDAECKALFAGTRNYRVIRDVEEFLPDLRTIILFEGHDVVPVKDSKKQYEDYMTLFKAQTARAESVERAYDLYDPSADELASIIYTSGTTGRPKGAMLRHSNFASNVTSLLQAIDISESDNFMLILPLHHAFAFTANLLVPIGARAEISFVENLKTIRENMAEAHPTVLIGVPLLLEKMYLKIQAGLKKKISARLMMAMGLSKVVGRKLIARLGGQLRVVVSGAAPIDPDVLRGWQKLGISVIEGYGLTETAPVSTLNPLQRSKPGSIGLPIPGVDVQIRNADGEGVGEIAIRGPNVMAGYYKNPAATEEIMDGDWLMTGDLGYKDEEGYLFINGRKKSLIVNREGKNIYPEEVEHQLCKSRYILEALALGYRPPEEKAGERVGVIIVPNQEAIDDYATHHKKKMSDEDIEQLIQQEVKQQCRELADYKRPRRVQVQYEEFEKTSTQKIKRYLYAIDTARL
ncbi:MAG: long-chain fatty acid--CoA ligase [Spartobacteria bacterium]|nr:long-chain fatty acid--CoA ligase [Spartobacteria bacterium]